MADETYNREEVTRQFVGIIPEIRQRRVMIEQEWLKADDAWLGIQTYSYYESEFKHFIPAFRRTIEKQLVRTVEQLMPHHEFFQMYPGNELDVAADEQMIPTHRYMDWLVNDWIKIRKVVKQCVRTFYLFSRCITKNTVRVYDLPEIKEGKIKGPIQQVWPQSRCVDPFAFYVWPETCSTLEDASLVFEDVVMPYTEYEEAVKLGLADDIPREDLRPPQWPYHVNQRLARQGITEPRPVGTAEEREKQFSQHFVQFSECYYRGTGNRWVMGWLVWNIATPKFTRLQLARYHRPPYRMAVARELPTRHYTPGMGQDIEALQVLLNDQFNQGEETRAVSSGPPVIIDPARVKRAESFIFGYRRKWYGDPAGVKMLDIPDTSQSALRAAQFTLAYMEGFGPSGLMQGQPPRGTPRGSAAVSQLVAMAGADIVDAAKTIEEECLTPTLQDLYDLTCAFVPDVQIVQIPGAEQYKPMTTTMAELFGGWRFKWAGASRYQDKQADAQQAMAYVQNLMRQADVLHQQGWKIDWGTMNRLFWKDILGERRLAEVIQQMTPEERQAEAQLQAQMMQMQQARQQPGPRGSGGMGGS